MPKSASSRSIASSAASCRPTASKRLDGSLLLIPLVGFLPSTIRGWGAPSEASRAGAATMNW